MEFPHLRAALDAGVGMLQQLLKDSVPVDTGSLRDSIVLTGVVNGNEVKMSITLNDYWKYICSGSRVNKEPVPVPEILRLEPDIIIGRYRSLNGAIEAVIGALNAALEKDILESISI